MRETLSEDVRPPHPSKLDRRTPLADLPEWLSVQEFYQYVGIGRSAAYELLRRGEIPHRKFGRSVRVPKTALQVLWSATVK
jgi:excisionase family DNA binding protein